ncbi:MAG: hypothetical protein MAG794_00427 [Gammaproteobacteria bacterium]|nr:hypothetical protein [Gammaproteobacteria bacterium]
MNKLRILIIDHDERVCRMIDRITRRMELESLSVNNPRDVETVCLTFMPDFILFSPGAPEIDSEKVFEVLSEWNSEASVILLTGVDDEETVRLERLGQMFGLHMGDSIYKPIDVVAVKENLSALVERFSAGKKK